MKGSADSRSQLVLVDVFRLAISSQSLRGGHPALYSESSPPHKSAISLKVSDKGQLRNRCGINADPMLDFKPTPSHVVTLYLKQLSLSAGLFMILSQP